MKEQDLTTPNPPTDMFYPPQFLITLGHAVDTAITEWIFDNAPEDIQKLASLFLALGAVRGTQIPVEQDSKLLLANLAGEIPGALSVLYEKGYKFDYVEPTK